MFFLCGIREFFKKVRQENIIWASVFLFVFKLVWGKLCSFLLSDFVENSCLKALMSHICDSYLSTFHAPSNCPIFLVDFCCHHYGGDARLGYPNQVKCSNAVFEQRNQFPVDATVRKLASVLVWEMEPIVNLI